MISGHSIAIDRSNIPLGSKTHAAVGGIHSEREEIPGGLESRWMDETYIKGRKRLYLTVDKNGVNAAAIKAFKEENGQERVPQIKYLNNLVTQVH